MWRRLIAPILPFGEQETDFTFALTGTVASKQGMCGDK